MRPIELLPLTHSWPIFERGQRLDLGFLHDRERSALALPRIDGPILAQTGIGLWECDLRDNALIWSPEVHDLFGLPRDACPTRTETVALYYEDSRATMERLRAYAIKHRRGFTLDARIRPVTGGHRWMRLIAAPICEDGRVMRLHGLKRDVSSEYRHT